VAFLASSGCETSTVIKDQQYYLDRARAEIENYRVPDQKEFYGFVLGDELKGRENHRGSPDEETGGTQYTLPDPQGMFDFVRLQTDPRGVVLRIQFFKTFTSGGARSDFFNAVNKTLKTTYPVVDDHLGSVIWIRAAESDDDWLREYSEYLRRKDEWPSSAGPFYYVLHPTLALVECGMFEPQVGPQTRRYGVALEFTSKEYYRAREFHKNELQQRLGGLSQTRPTQSLEEGRSSPELAPVPLEQPPVAAQNTTLARTDREVVESWKAAAMRGDASAQYNLGTVYFHDEEDYKEALKWFTRAAEQQYAEAQFYLGVMYATGLGVPQDYQEAAKWLRKGAAQGHAYAQLKLGDMHRLGKGVSHDDEEAAKWYRKAAEQGQIEAQIHLARMYLNGEGIPQDDKEATRWLFKAAEQGDARAQLTLSVLYSKGRGVPEDYAEAYKWAILAATNGAKNGQVWKELLKDDMTPTQIEEGQRRAKEFAAARQGRLESGEALSNVTLITATGFFVTPAGYLLTARHVVTEATRVEVIHAERPYPAKIILQDESTDVALLKVEGTEFPCLSLVSSAAAKTGDSVFTMGFPQIQVQGTEAKFTEGSISALSGLGDSPRYFQISVPVQPGNSGGPLVNGRGEVVGLIVSRLDDVAALMATRAVPQTVNYALKSSFILPLIESVPGLADKLPKGSAARDRSAAIENTRKAVVLIVGYSDGGDSNASSPP